jgi:Membrane domain of glycerophosphoryl diester phosphodiesterase
MSLDLRPLTLGELLDRSFSLYRRHFWLFVGIMALPSLLALAFGVVVAIASPQPVSPESMASNDVNPAEIIGGVVWFVVAIIGMAAVYFITYAVALGATTVAVSELYLGRAISIRAAYTPMRGKVGRLALLLILISVRMFVALFLMLIVAFVSGVVGAFAAPILAPLFVIGAFMAAAAVWVWMMIRYAVAVPAVVLEDETPSAAIRRSIELTSGNLLRVFALLAFTMVITYAVLAIFQGPFVFAGIVAGPESSTAFWLNLAGTITGSIGGAFTGPLMIVAFAVLYYDLRVRKEGLDLQVMLANLNAVPPAAGTAATSAPLPG